MVPVKPTPPDYTNIERVMTAIVNERGRHARTWSAAHDYHLSPLEWVGLITKYAGRATEEGVTWEGLQERFITVAAICVAAVQALALHNYGPNLAAALNALEYSRQVHVEQQVHTPIVVELSQAEFLGILDSAVLAGANWRVVLDDMRQVKGMEREPFASWLTTWGESRQDRVVPAGPQLTSKCRRYTSDGQCQADAEFTVVGPDFEAGFCREHARAYLLEQRPQFTVTPIEKPEART